MSSSSENSTRHDNNERSLSSDSSDIGCEMAETNYKVRQESGPNTSMTPARPLSMKLFASWEIESSSSSCVPRLFSVKLTRLQIMKKMETNLNDVVISVSMQGSRRVLRSNEISLPPSGLIDTDVDLSFSLQYPHFLKRSRNNVQIMIQRRKRYKTRAILGFKTLAVGLVNLSEILQQPVNAKRPLHMHMKGDSTILATVTMTNLTSQPVENDLDREIRQRNSDDRTLEDNTTDEEDESYSSDGSDSAVETGPALQDILGPTNKGRKVKFRPNQMKFKKKFIALLKKFRVPEEEVFGEGSPREAEGGDDLADDLIYPEDLELFDSDADSDVELGDNSSIKSQDKPKLRPYFDRAASVDSMYVEKKTKSGKGVKKKMTRFDSEESTEAEHPIQEAQSPHSDSERQSDSPTAHSDTPPTHTHLQKLKDGSNKTRRSLSVKENKNKNKVKLERRKSDLQIQDVPKSTILEQLTACFPSDDQLPPSILMVNTSEWQGQLLALKLKGKQSRIICTNTDNEVQDVIATILTKYQKFCHNHSNSPPCLKIAIAGTEGYIGVVLRPFVEQFSSKPTWQNYVRFLVIPLESNHSVGKYISHIDSTYSSLFMDSVWKDVFEKPDSNADFEAVNHRINKYVKGASVTHHLPIAEALINRHGSDDDSSRFVPFVGMVRIGCVEPGETEDIVNGNTASSGTSQVTHVKDSSQMITVNASSSPPNEMKCGSTANKESSPQTPFLCNEVMDLQVDYWTTGGKKEGSKSTLKTAFKSLVVCRHHNIEEPGTLQMIATTKEQNLRKVHPKSAFEAMMRVKKSKERESDTKGMIVANVTKLVCTSKSQSDSLSVVIDGVSWDDVKFFSISPQWSRHVKTFPIGLIGPVESCF